MRINRGLVLVAAAAASARAGDEPLKVDPRTASKWETGEVVTAVVQETTRTTMSLDAPGGSAPELVSILDAKFVQRCVEADAAGALVRSLVRVDAWSLQSATGLDTCLEGALIEPTATGWKLVTARMNPSRRSRMWLDTRFGGDARGFSGGLEELGAPGPVAAGATWEAAAPAIPLGLAQSGFPITFPERPWRFTVAEITKEKTGTALRVTFSETFAASGDGRLRGFPVQVAEGSTAEAHGFVTGVPGQWHRTGRMKTDSSMHLVASMRGAEVRLDQEGGETEIWLAGGERPEMPKAAPRVAIGAGETWTVGDAVTEAGTERVVTVTTPVDDDGKAGTSERSEVVTSWTAEIECAEASAEGALRAMTVTLTAWRSVDGGETDESLAGSVIRVKSEGMTTKIDGLGRRGQSERARRWARRHFGRLGDATRTAITPVMLVAPLESWRTDHDAASNAVLSRFDYTFDGGGARGTATLTTLDGAGGDASASIDYEIEARILGGPGGVLADPDVTGGSMRIRGTASGPVSAWTRLGSFRDEAEVSLALPGEEAGEEIRRVAITATRDVRRSPVDPNVLAARTLTASGDAKAKAGDQDGAIEDYTKALEADPRNTNAWFGRGRARTARDDTDGAIADYTKAIEADPRSFGSWLNRATLRLGKGDAAGAAEDTSKAIEISPRSAMAWTNRAIARTELGDIDGAIGDYTKAVEVNPKYVTAWSNRGTLRDDRGDHDGAIEDYTKAIELDPKHADAWFNRARSRGAKGDLEGAIADCTRAIELDPKYTAAWNRRGGLRLDADDWDGAMADWTHAIELDPKRSQAHESIARARFAPGLPAAPVVEGFRTVIGLAGDHDYDHLVLWLARTHLGEEAAATKELKEHVAARKPEGDDDWYPVVAGLLAGTVTEEAALARAAVADAKQSAERLCEAAFYAGLVRALHGDAAGAVPLLDRCLATGVTHFTEHDGARCWRPALLLGATTRALRGDASAEDAPVRRTLVSPDPSGPAARAGLADGDVITAVDGQPPTKARLDEVLLAGRIGTTVRVDVLRRGEPVAATVTLGVWQAK